MNYFEGSCDKLGDEDLVKHMPRLNRILPFGTLQNAAETVAILTKRISEARMDVESGLRGPVRMPRRFPVDLRENLLALVDSHLSRGIETRGLRKPLCLGSTTADLLNKAFILIRKAEAARCSLECFIMPAPQKASVVIWPALRHPGEFYGRTEALAAARALPALCKEVQRVSEQLTRLADRAEASKASARVLAGYSSSSVGRRTLELIASMVREINDDPI